MLDQRGSSGGDRTRWALTRMRAGLWKRTLGVQAARAPRSHWGSACYRARTPVKQLEAQDHHVPLSDAEGRGTTMNPGTLAQEDTLPDGRQAQVPQVQPFTPALSYVSRLTRQWVLLTPFLSFLRFDSWRYHVFLFHFTVYVWSLNFSEP